MASVVAAFGTSHSPMMVASAASWGDGSYIARDRSRVLFDHDGSRSTYDALQSKVTADGQAQLSAATLATRHAMIGAAMQRMSDDLAAARLDALVVIGDDQQELFGDDNMPAIGLYHGSSIRNGPAGTDPGLVYPEPQHERRYPCHGHLAHHLITALVSRDFDVAAMGGLLDGKSEGHAFSFVHRFLMGASPVPVVPVFLNAYYPPNQPTPARCYDLGVALAAAIRTFPDDIRVGIMASGGLSHFVVDEAFDRTVIGALQTGDREYLRTLPLHKLRSGSSEIRNWVCLAGAAAGLTPDWVTYVPGYRTPALTGTGLCLAAFKEEK